jgi:glutamyl-tRNA synthetase
MKKDEKTIKKHALINAVEYSGKANPKAVLGKVLAEKPSLKVDVSATYTATCKIVEQVNSWDLEKQKKELKKFGKIKKPKKVERKDLPPLPNAKKGKVVTRLAPEPSKYSHIGHALTFIINYMYAKRYKGKCVLRFEDTNPEKVRKEYVQAMKEDVIKYLGIKPSKIVFSSDHMPKMYKFAEKLIKSGDCYICTCPRKKLQKMRWDGIGCECREGEPKKNMQLWKKMIKKKMKKGEAVLRMKIDMQSQNRVMRDPVLFRINYAEHFRQKKKYGVWPLYDFQNVVEDELCGVTHILRSSEFGKMRIELQNYMKKLLGFRIQTIVQYGRFEVKGAITKGREIRKLLEDGKISGWDDPRLVTLKALKKRGIVKETYYGIAKKLGLNASHASIQWNMIASENRKIIDSKAKRYFFVGTPIQISLDRLTTKTAKVPYFPGKRTYRKIPVTKKIFVDKIDFTQNRNKEVRLMHFCNVILNKKSKVTSKKLKDVPKIHWVGIKNVKVKLIMPNAKEVEGFSEPEIRKVKPGDLIQFERIGFARCDKPKVFYFAHK